MLFLATVLSLFAVACKKEKVDPLKPTITWESNPGFRQVELTSDLDATVTISAPGQIQDVKLVLNLGANNNLVNQYIKLDSNKSKGGSNPVLDLVEDESAANLLGGLGMRVGKTLRGKEQLQLDLKKILERILQGQIVDNNTTFSIEVRVTDQANNPVSNTAKFHFTAAPTITWDKNESFGEVVLDPSDRKDCKVKVWAPGKIDQLTVKLEDGADALLTTLIRNRTTDSVTTMDLVNDAKVADGLKGYFPAASAVSDKDQVILDFAFMYDWSYDIGASLNVFTVHAVDKNGKEAVVQVKFRKN